MIKTNTNPSYSTQGVAQELKAQNENNNLVEIDLSLEAKTYLAYKYRVSNRDKLLKELKRANPELTKQIFKKSRVLCKQAVELAETVLKKIFSGKRVLLNHKYISKITECDSTDQNKRILDQLDNFFIIKYHRLAIVDGIPYNYHYSFELHPAIIEELKDAGLWNLEFMPAFLRLSYNNRPDTSSRSNIDLGAKISQNSNSKEINNTSSIDTKKEQVVSTNTKATIVEQKQVKPSPRPANKRKTKTKAEIKGRIYKFPQYDKPKSLADHYPLSQEDCYELQKRSGKDYSLNGMNEILLAMSRKPKLQGHLFASKALFMSYMTKAYQKEDRDVDKVNSPTFKIMKGRSQEEVAQIVTLAEREKYMNETENAGIHTRCDYTQLRAKIAGQFPINLGYDLLKDMIGVKKQETVLEIIMHKGVELTEHYKQLLLNHANAVGGYCGVDELELLEV